MVTRFQESKNKSCQTSKDLAWNRRVSLLSHSIGQNELKYQPRLKDRRNRMYLLMEGVVCAYRDGRHCWLPSWQSMHHIRHGWTPFPVIWSNVLLFLLKPVSRILIQHSMLAMGRKKMKRRAAFQEKVRTVDAWTEGEWAEKSSGGRVFSAH